MKKRLFNQQSEPGSREAATAQRLSVKARIMMALFALMLIPQGAWAQYDLKIGNQEFSGSGITDLSALQEFTGIITRGSVVYNHNSHTLSLNGATISGSIVWNYQDNLNIELEGDNVLTGRIIANNSYTLTFIKSSASASSCSLTISPSGVAAAAPSAISGFSDVWYEGVYLVSAYPVAYDGSQMKMLDYQNLNSPSDASSISLKSDQVYHRIWVNGTQLTDLTLTTLAPNLVYSGSPDSDDGGTRTLTLNNYTANGPIVSDLPNLTIQFVGTNKINTDGQSNSSSGAADNAILSYNPSATLTFQKNGDGTLELDGKDTPKSAIAGFASVNYGDGCYLKADKPTKYSSDDKCYINFANGNAFVDVVTISTDVYYPLWIGTSTTAATQVTTTTITAGVTAGTVTFTPAIGTTSSKLTLNSATLTAKILSGLGDLVVEVLGSNKINSSDSGTIFRSVNKGELTIKKASSDAALELEVFGYDNHPAIQGFHTLSYSNFDLNTSATTPTYGVFNDGSSNIYGLYDPNASVNKAIKQATFAKNYDLWVNGTRVTSANASNIGPSGTDFSFDPTESTLHYRSGGTTPYPILSGLPNLTIKIGSPDNGDYSKNNISIIKFGAPTGVTIAATSGNLTLSKEDGVTGVQQFDIVAYGSEILIQGFDNVTYSDFVILQDGATYNTTNKQLEYPNPSGSGFVGYGGISATFVTPQDISNYYVADIANKDYTGSALAPAITVMETAASATSLVENTDYTVSYKLSGAVTTPIDANTYNVIIDGKGRYTGSITTKTFTIDPIAVTLSWSGTSFTFDGDAHKPTATATGLIGSDVCNVTVTGEQTNASATAYTATATALDNNNYKLPAAVTQTFTITPCSLASARIDDISAQTYTYSGSEIMPTPGVGIKLGKSTTETPLSAGTDFEYTYANNKNAAKANDNLPPTVTITGKGNYNGTRVVKFTIDQVDMSTSTDITIEAVPDQTYTGSAITPTPTVKFKGNDLVAGTGNDFVYSYLNNTNAALSTDPTAPPTVTITGSGNFKNSTSVKFTILDRTASVAFGSGRTYMTFCDPSETFLVPDGVKAYIVTAVSGSTVTIKQVSYIPKNVPVLLESTSSTYTNTKDPNDTFTGNMLSFAAAAVTTDGNQYVLYSDEFVKATGTIPVGKVYLTFTSPVRRLTIDRNNSATAIEAIVEEAADGEQWYDMQGRKINKPSKDGLYIKNGKKVVVNNK